MIAVLFAFSANSINQRNQRNTIYPLPLRKNKEAWVPEMPEGRGQGRSRDDVNQKPRRGRVQTQLCGENEQRLNEEVKRDVRIKGLMDNIIQKSTG